jgi:hypothetical protein
LGAELSVEGANRICSHIMAKYSVELSLDWFVALSYSSNPADSALNKSINSELIEGKP